MIKVEKSIIIKKSIEEVFAYSQNKDNYSKWQGDGSIQMLEGPDNVVGSRYLDVSKFLGKEMKSTMEITAFKENEKWAAKVIKGPVPHEVTMTYNKLPEGTKLTIAVEGESKGFFKLAEGIVASSIEKDMEESLNRLKSILEGV